jgi:methionyl-tRNA formyltransferase
MKTIAFIGNCQFARAMADAIHRAGVRFGQIVGWPYDEKVSGHMSMPHYSTLSKNIITKEINSAEVIEAVGRCDLLVCGGWSRLFGKALLEACPLGAVNLHPTLLPEGRGRAPIPTTILKGLTRSGVTLYYMTEGCDDGDIIGQEAFSIDPDETATTLYRKCVEAGEKLCRELVPRLLQGDAPRTPQDHSKATRWDKRTPEDSWVEIDELGWDHDLLWRYVRALEWPYPRAYIQLWTSQGPRKVYLSTKAGS